MIERLQAAGKTGAVHLGAADVQRARRPRGRRRHRARRSRTCSAATCWINGGFFVFRREIFDDISPGEELVDEPFARLIERGELLAYRYDGFWEPMDTLKDKQRLDALRESGKPPWRSARRRRATAIG